eukprot:SAG11_NODE_75_length_18024_cov_5.885356_5_plen_44_part_00
MPSVLESVGKTTFLSLEKLSSLAGLSTFFFTLFFLAKVGNCVK